MNHRVRSTPYGEVRRGLVSRGLRPGLPGRCREAYCRDAEMLRREDAECEACRLVTLRLEAWTDGSGYVALTVCRACGHAVEI